MLLQISFWEISLSNVSQFECVRLFIIIVNTLYALLLLIIKNSKCGEKNLNFHQFIKRSKKSNICKIKMIKLGTNLICFCKFLFDKFPFRMSRNSSAFDSLKRTPWLGISFLHKLKLNSIRFFKNLELCHLSL